MDTKGSKDIKEVFGVLGRGFLALIPGDARKKKDVEEGQAAQEHATNDPTLARRKHFTYLTLLLIAALTINRKHPSLGNVHAPVRKLSKERGLIDAALAILVRGVEVLAGIQLTGYPHDHPKILLSASPGVLFATVANPRLNSKSAQQNLKEVEFRKLGDDLWPMIYQVGKGGKRLEAIMRILKPKSRTGLAGHIATVKGYLNWYSAVEPTQREEASALFTLYLVTTCWKKMWMRIRHWTAVGMIYQLAMVSPELLKVGLKAYLATNQTLPDIHHDDYLRETARRSVNQELKSILVEMWPLQTKDAGPLSIDPTVSLSAFLDSGVYAEDTLLGFHTLLVGTLFCYARMFREVKEQFDKFQVTSTKPKKDEEGEASEKDTASKKAAKAKAFEEAKKEAKKASNDAKTAFVHSVHEAWALAILLSAILNSKLFRLHLDILLHISSFKILREGDLTKFQQFAQDMDLCIMSPRRRESATDLQGCVDEVATVEGDDDAEGERREEGDDDDEEDEARVLADSEDEEEDEAQEHAIAALLQQGSDNQRSKRSKRISRWAKLLTCHISATHVLETYARNVASSDVSSSTDTDPVVDIILLGTPRESFMLPDWTDLRSIIMSVVLRPKKWTKGDAELLAEYVERQVDNTSSVVKRQVTVMQRLQDIRKGRSGELTCVAHCEAILMALAKDTHATGRALELQMLMDMSHLSITKLCCPACFDLHDILSRPLGSDSADFDTDNDNFNNGTDSDNDNFNNGSLDIPGRHTTVYPVLLPAGLDPTVVDKMITRFENYLYREFERMRPKIKGAPLDPRRASVNSLDTVESESGWSQHTQDHHLMPDLTQPKTLSFRILKALPMLKRRL